MNLAELNENFALPGILAFEEANGLARVQITLPTCAATVFLHGAHLTHWQPTGEQPVLFLSPRSEFAEAKAIRGGIPICFPWFGNGLDGTRKPSHGFARLLPWDVAFAALAGDQLHLTLTLAPTDLSRSLGFSAFRVAYELIFGADEGRTLTLRLSVANPGPEPLVFEEALHTYFHVGDVKQASLTGLEGALYLDKRDSLREKHAPATPLEITSQTDRIFPANSAAVTLHDPVLGRTIQIAKSNSASTVVWNPWDDGSASIADLAPDSWPGFLCVEAANLASDALTLAPGEAHTTEARIALI